MAYKIIDRDLERCQDWLGDRTNGVGYDMVQAIGLERDGELVAVTGYNNITEKACHVHFAIDKGVVPPRNFVWFVHYYPFVQLGLNSMIAMVSSTNKRILRLAKHLGYSVLSIIESADLVLLALNKNDCKWLNYGIK